MGALQIQHRGDAELVEEYGCSFWRILPWLGEGASEEGAGLAMVAPGASTEAHGHAEAEYFFVVRGEGRAWVEGESNLIVGGDVLAVAPNCRHHFENTSSSDPLELLCVWTLAGGGSS
jgi:quercetin dioxygenase-like cupin family protein